MIAVTYREYEKQIAVLRHLAKDLSIEGHHAFLHQWDKVNQLMKSLLALQN